MNNTNDPTLKAHTDAADNPRHHNQDEHRKEQEGKMSIEAEHNEG
jgi:hypothetical protein